MAATQKVTRIHLQPSLAGTAGFKTATVDLSDPTVNPSIAYTVNVEVSDADAEVNADLQTAIDAELTAQSKDTVDWTI